MTTTKQPDMPDEIWAWKSNGNGQRWHSQPNIPHDQNGAKYIRADLSNPVDSVAVGKVRDALRMFMGSAYFVSTDIDKRGYKWSEAYLDQAWENGKDVMRSLDALPQVVGGDVREASSACPICGHDKPHWHDKDEWAVYQVHQYYFERLYIDTAMREGELRSFQAWGIFPKNKWADVGNGAPLLKNPLQQACWKFFLGAIKLVEDKDLAQRPTPAPVTDEKRVAALEWINDKMQYLKQTSETGHDFSYREKMKAQIPIVETIIAALSTPTHVSQAAGGEVERLANSCAQHLQAIAIDPGWSKSGTCPKDVIANYIRAASQNTAQDRREVSANDLAVELSIMQPQSDMGVAVALAERLRAKFVILEKK